MTSWSSYVTKDTIILLFLLNYFVIIVLKRYRKYRQYRFYPEDMTFIKYLIKNFISLPILFYSVIVLFVELAVVKVLNSY
jgi:hypothetical protein